MQSTKLITRCFKSTLFLVEPAALFLYSVISRHRLNLRLKGVGSSF